jgi:hypothetical protein
MDKEWPMRNRERGVWSSLLLAGGLVLTFALPAAARDIYAWRTDDGVYAFSGEIDAVPERYRDEVEVRRSASLTDYRRYTAEDDAAADRYEEELAERLALLRDDRVGQPAMQPTGTAATRAPDYVTVRSGGRNGGGVEVSTPISGGDAALETDTVNMRRKNGMLTQPVRVTRRGDKIISVDKPRNRVYSLDDVVDEGDLDALMAE